MFGAEVVGKGLSFVKVLSGLNKTLSIANQVIPLYQQAKPMISNAKTAFKVLKEFTGSQNTPKNSSAKSQNKMKVAKTPQKKKNGSVTSSSTSLSNQPVFFV